jgi:uncharacterized protein DUF6496
MKPETQGRGSRDRGRGERRTKASLPSKFRALNSAPACHTLYGRSIGVLPSDKERDMAKYGKKASEKVEKVMKEMKAGKLKSGNSGKKVTSRKQAIAIGLSEARAAGGKVPPPKKSSAKRASSHNSR